MLAVLNIESTKDGLIFTPGTVNIQKLVIHGLQFKKKCIDTDKNLDQNLTVDELALFQLEKS